MKMKPTLDDKSLEKELLKKAVDLWENKAKDKGIPKSVWVFGVSEHLRLASESSLDKNNADKALDKLAEHPIYGQLLTDEIKILAPEIRGSEIIKKMLEKAESELDSLDNNAFADIRDHSKHSGSLEKTEASIGRLRLKLLKKELAGDSLDAKVFRFKAAESDYLDQAVSERTQNNPALWFVEPEIKDDIYRHLLRPLSEGRDGFTRVQNLIDIVALKQENHNMRPPQGNVAGVTGIVLELEKALSRNHQIGAHTLNALKIDFEEVFRDRFHKADSQTFTIEKHHLKRIAESHAPNIKKGCNPLEVADEFARDIYACARFDRTHSVVKDIENRFGKQPEDRTKKTAGKDSIDEFGMDAKVAAAGLGISAVSGIFSHMAKANSIPEPVKPGQSSEDFAAQEKKRKLRSTRNIVFATVFSVVGTGVLLDGLMFEGRYTKSLLNKFRGGGKSNGGGMSLN